MSLCPTGHGPEVQCPICRGSNPIPTIDRITDGMADESAELRPFSLEVAIDGDNAVVPIPQLETLVSMTTFNSVVLDVWQRRHPDEVGSVLAEANLRAGGPDVAA